MKNALSITMVVFLLGVFGSPVADANTLVIPHMVEQAGSFETTNTFDTTVFVTYTESQAGIPADATSTSVDVYLYDEATGMALTSDTGFDICSPCSFPMGRAGLGNPFDPTTGDNNPAISPRKRKLSVEQMIRDGNGGTFLASGIVTGYIIVVVNGNVDAVNVSGAVINIGSGPTDLSVTMIEAQPVPAAAAR